MTKGHLSATIEQEVLDWIEKYRKDNYPGLSRSAVVEILLREVLRGKTIHERRDIAIA